jgi:hypothetical protein
MKDIKKTFEFYKNFINVKEPRSNRGLETILSQDALSKLQETKLNKARVLH